MLEDWGCREGGAQAVESFLCCWRPFELGILPQERRYGTDNLTEIPDKTSIEVCKPQEDSYVVN